MVMEMGMGMEMVMVMVRMMKDIAKTIRSRRINDNKPLLLTNIKTLMYIIKFISHHHHHHHHHLSKVRQDIAEESFIDGERLISARVLVEHDVEKRSKRHHGIDDDNVVLNERFNDIVTVTKTI